jgi:cellulose biosynthesis protein BcsQ
MIALTVYAEAGGSHKTTVATNLAVAFERMGLDTLVIDLDPQEANVSYIFDVQEGSDDPEADNLVRHMLEQPNGDFSDLIKSTDEGPDVIPAHGMLENFTSNLERKIQYLEGMGNSDEFNRYGLLYDLLWDQEQLHNKYDALIIDPNARAEDNLYNAIYATRTIVAPVKPAGKGNLSLNGLDELLHGMQNNQQIDVGVAAVVPSDVGTTNANERYKERFKAEEGYHIPVAIGSRESMMDEMWDAQGSAFKVVEERWKDGQVGTRKVRDREIQTIKKFWDLASDIAQTMDTSIPNPELVLEIDGREAETYTPGKEVTA